MGIDPRGQIRSTSRRLRRWKIAFGVPELRSDGWRKGSDWLKKIAAEEQPLEMMTEGIAVGMKSNGIHAPHMSIRCWKLRIYKRKGRVGSKFFQSTFVPHERWLMGRAGRIHPHGCCRPSGADSEPFRERDGVPYCWPVSGASFENVWDC